jgi:hypothetical protein
MITLRFACAAAAGAKSAENIAAQNIAPAKPHNVAHFADKTILRAIFIFI